MAGGASPIARVMGQIDAANSSGAARGAGYTPVEANVYGSPFTSQQATPLPRTSPLALQMMQRSNAVNPYGQGLQSIYSMFNRPQMPMYRVPALAYRPDMQSSQEVLRRVAPSVAEQQRRQAIEDARRAAEEAARQEPPYDPYYGSYSNPGG